MKTIINLIAMLFFTIMCPLSMAQITCTEVSVMVMPFTFSTTTAQSARAISEIQANGQAHNFNERQVGLGLVAAHRYVRVTSSSVGEGCQQIKVEAGYDDVTLYVAQELRELSTCGHRHVLAHELKHVEVYDMAIAKLKVELTPRIEQALEAQSNKTIDQLIAVASVLTNQYMDNVKLMQDTLDSPEEYSHFERVCQGELARATKILNN